MKQAAATQPLKAVQYFSDEYLAHCQQMSSEAIVDFLDDFRRLHGSPGLQGPSKLISLKVPEPLLHAFRQRCEQEGVKYQSQIKQLMMEYLSG